MDVKAVHERLRGLMEAPEEERHEIRGKIKNFYVIQRYTRSNEGEVEEVFVSSPEVNISLVINSKGLYSVTYVKDGRIEGKSLSEEEAKKVIDDIIKLLS